MYVHPNRLNALKWPLKFFRTIMGGRLPHSKKGIIKHIPMEVPEEVRKQLVWRVEELADSLGFKLVEKESSIEREYIEPSSPRRQISFEFEGLRE
jgi:hypothetical protein